MWSKCPQNRPNNVQIKGCDRQTDRQTHKQTHTQTNAQTRLVQDLDIQSSEMAEYKKRKGDKQKHGKRFRERKREQDFKYEFYFYFFQTAEAHKELILCLFNMNLIDINKYKWI